MRITERERQILKLLIQGKSNREIADTLNLSVSTVKEYCGRLYSKFSVRNRTGLIIRVISDSVGHDWEVTGSGRLIVNKKAPEARHKGKDASR